MQMPFSHSTNSPPIGAASRPGCARMNHQSDDGKLGEVYVFDEVCNKLKISRSSLSDLIRGTSFYSRKGDVYRFSDAESWRSGQACGLALPMKSNVPAQ